MPPGSFLAEKQKCWIEYGERPISSETSGKWLIFTQKKNIESLWNVIMRNRRFLNLKYVKASTPLVNIWGGRPKIGVVMVHYENLSDKEVLELGNSIKKNTTHTLLIEKHGKK